MNFKSIQENEMVRKENLMLKSKIILIKKADFCN